MSASTARPAIPVRPSSRFPPPAATPARASGHRGLLTGALATAFSIVSAVMPRSRMASSIAERASCRCTTVSTRCIRIEFQTAHSGHAAELLADQASSVGQSIWAMRRRVSVWPAGISVMSWLSASEVGHSGRPIAAFLAIRFVVMIVCMDLLIMQ